MNKFNIEIWQPPSKEDVLRHKVWSVFHDDHKTANILYSAFIWHRGNADYSLEDIPDMTRSAFKIYKKRIPFISERDDKEIISLLSECMDEVIGMSKLR